MSYDPTLGRFVEMDPAMYIDGPNLYQMELSNPIRYVDPLGLKAKWVDSGCKKCEGYISGDQIWDGSSLWSAHTFLTVDGKGAGLYAWSNAGGPKDSSGGIGVVETAGVVRGGDEGKYPSMNGARPAKPGTPYSLCKTIFVNEACNPGAAKKFHDRLLANINAQLGGKQHYGVAEHNCSDWVNEMIRDAEVFTFGNASYWWWDADHIRFQ
jgi:hypothetical protein